MKQVRLLLLAGTSEAAEIARFLAGQSHIDARASMAGATRAPRDLAILMRLGGFGGAEGFKRYLEEHKIDLVVDATHPFAEQMTRTASAVCKETKTPYLLVQRPAWVPQKGDIWHQVDSIEEVKALIPAESRVFLATGRMTLAEFEGMERCTVLCRVIDPPKSEFPFKGGRFVVGRPPFSVEDEVSLFEDEKIDWLVVKNSGGERSRSKLDAARLLGMPVAMLNRPATPRVDLVESVEAAITWIVRKTKE